MREIHLIRLIGDNLVFLSVKTDCLCKELGCLLKRVGCWVPN